MNDLREKLLTIVDSGEVYPEETVDRVIDAVIAVLPEEKQVLYTLKAHKHSEEVIQRMYRYGGFDFAIRLVKQTLEDARGVSNEQDRP